MLIYADSGVVVEYNGKRIALDPSKEAAATDMIFVSHAHTDHMHRPVASRARVVASMETLRIAEARGFRYPNATHEPDPGVQMLNSGHVLGSRALLIDDKILYTGDICTRDRAFLKGARLPRCDTLIIESTYGRRGYRFPSVGDVVHRVNTLISEMYSKGLPVILMGYPLGKAQIITSLFRHWEPLYIHESVARINSIYRELGVELGDDHAVVYSSHSDDGRDDDGYGYGGLKHGPWLMVAPKQSNDSTFVRMMKKRYNAVTIAFTGWALAPWHTRLHDYTIPLSDHCDFDELVQVVNACRPNRVYTFHGFADEFASHLRGMGYDAEAIGSNKRILDYI
ncbi:MAG: MBL fold metallo-hydrolase [Candidatus Nitrosocaldus sp.]|nr:MBL fold metallo-hydrolase [Candidatus Nitrosocaldus sp.]